MRAYDRPVLASLFTGIAGSWLIGRACHVLGIRHTGGHMLAEVLVLSVVAFVAIVIFDRFTNDHR